MVINCLPNEDGENEEGGGTERNSLANTAHLSIAYAELYLIIARIVRSFKMELYDTTMEDIEVYHSRIVGHPRKVKGQNPEGRGEVKVKVIGKTE